MQTATEQLQAIADAWAQRLGGKMPVEINVVIYSGRQKYRAAPSFGAYIGEIGDRAEWKAFGGTAEGAMQEAERLWTVDGAPAELKDVEKSKLKARAAELGLKLVEE